VQVSPQAIEERMTPQAAALMRRLLLRDGGHGRQRPRVPHPHSAII
jgi:hypothetical protein